MDPSGDKDVPGWPLRNLLYTLNKTFGLNKIKIICYRENKMESCLFDTELPEKATYTGNYLFIAKSVLKLMHFSRR